MEAIRLHSPGLGGLRVEEIEDPSLEADEALVEVHAAAITRDELDWPVDRVPAIPSYELSGLVAAVGREVSNVAPGDAVYALTPFDRDGVAATHASVPAAVLALKPSTLDHVASAAIPLAALSAWQGLFDHGRLDAGERVVITGAAGGVGHMATQLARRRGAHVIAVVSRHSLELARSFGAHEAIDRTNGSLDEIVEPVDLVFDTAGGDLLQRAPAMLREGGRLVSVADEAPASAEGIETVFFIVEPNRDQLQELARLADEGALKPAIDSVYPLAEARDAFERSLARGKRGKVVLRVLGGD
jgi:NADPH:quinone reductase-like Zn-dependent oxidoreductase